MVSVEGGLALVVYDPSVEISITEEGITYTLGFEKLYAGTWQVTIKALGVMVATIEVPEYGITLEGKEVSGVLLSLPEIDREKLDQMVASAKGKLVGMRERAKVVWGSSNPRLPKCWPAWLLC